VADDVLEVRHQPGRRQGGQSKYDEADAAGDQEGIAIEGVVAPVAEVQPEGDGDDHWQVKPDVDGVEDLDQQVAVEDEVLEVLFPEDAEVSLDVDDGGRPLVSAADSPAHGAAHETVCHVRGHDNQQFHDMSS
jgi:hypothetical protein